MGITNYFQKSRLFVILFSFARVLSSTRYRVTGGYRGGGYWNPGTRSYFQWKKLFKSVNIWQNYGHESVAPLFWPTL